MQRALVTGGAGFIGSHVVERFRAAGMLVEVLDDLSSGRAENVPDGVDLHELDVCSDRAAEVVAGKEWDVVVHLAAQMDVRRSVADPLFDARANILGTLNLLEALRETRGSAGRRPRIVFASTGGAVYGDLGSPPNREDTVKEPDSPYAVSKLSAEYYLALYGRLHGYDCISLRFANVYGPRQDPHGEAGVVAIFCGRILSGEPLRVFGDGTQTRDYVYVGDVAEATFLAASTPVKGTRLDERAVNIGTGEETSVLKLAATLQAAAGSDVPIEFAPARAGEQLRSVLDVRRARSVLGWTPRTSLEAGLQATYEWFEARGASPPLPPPRPASSARF